MIFSCLNLFVRQYVIINEFLTATLTSFGSELLLSGIFDPDEQRRKEPWKGRKKKCGKNIPEKSYLYPETTGFPVRLLINETPH